MGKSACCEERVLEIGVSVVNGSSDAAATYITMFKVQVHTTVQEYDIVPPMNNP